MAGLREAADGGAAARGGGRGGGGRTAREGGARHPPPRPLPPRHGASPFPLPPSLTHSLSRCLLPSLPLAVHVSPSSPPPRSHSLSASRCLAL
eukprot:2014676-Rhodomonas_salina.1